MSGSDGKDDLIIGEDDEGDVMHDNETLFPNTLHESQADMDTILYNLKKKGKLMDDLSLVKLEILI